MAKPTFAQDLQVIADRGQQLRSLVADQKKEELEERVCAAASADSPGAAQNSQITPRANPDRRADEAPLSRAVDRIVTTTNSVDAEFRDHGWSRRLTYLSTRVPEDMRDLIDDLLFVLRKDARKQLDKEPTLQDLACEAWSDLLYKYSRRLS